MLLNYPSTLISGFSLCMEHFVVFVRCTCIIDALYYLTANLEDKKNVRITKEEEIEGRKH